ncbi:MAG: leucine-rich repeat domain-containing protein [Simkaniaceae bacterium]|nr:leucine-rich repeat domain-containing protein [Simkaniaceae bacterium]
MTVTAPNEATNIFQEMPSEIMQTILIKAEASPSIARVSKRWNAEIHDITIRLFSFIAQDTRENLTDLQVQQAQDLFKQVAKKHLHFYPNEQPASYLQFPRISIPGYSTMIQEIELAKAQETIKFWGFLPGGQSHIDSERSIRPQLSDIDLARDLSDWITKTPEVQQLGCLNLRNKELRYVPPEIGQLTDLFMLSLSRCPIDILPKEIGNLKRLFKLDLNQTKLVEIPPITLFTLGILDISGSPLEASGELRGFSERDGTNYWSENDSSPRIQLTFAGSMKVDCRVG